LINDRAEGVRRTKISGVETSPKAYGGRRGAATCSPSETVSLFRNKTGD
jgi:hypothetical protein